MARETSRAAATDVPAGLAHTREHCGFPGRDRRHLRRCRPRQPDPVLNEARSRLSQVERQAAESIRLTWRSSLGPVDQRRSVSPAGTHRSARFERGCRTSTDCDGGAQSETQPGGRPDRPQYGGGCAANQGAANRGRSASVSDLVSRRRWGTPAGPTNRDLFVQFQGLPVTVMAWSRRTLLSHRSPLNRQVVRGCCPRLGCAKSECTADCVYDLGNPSTKIRL